MTQTIKIQEPSYIYPSQLEDGELAVLVKDHNRHLVGTVVQRFAETIIVLGKGRGHSYSTIISLGDKAGMRLRRLESGDKIIVEG